MVRPLQRLHQVGKKHVALELFFRAVCQRQWREVEKLFNGETAKQHGFKYRLSLFFSSEEKDTAAAKLGLINKRVSKQSFLQ